MSLIKSSRYYDGGKALAVVLMAVVNAEAPRLVPASAAAMPTDGPSTNPQSQYIMVQLELDRNYTQVYS